METKTGQLFVQIFKWQFKCMFVRQSLYEAKFLMNDNHTQITLKTVAQFPAAFAENRLCRMKHGHDVAYIMVKLAKKSGNAVQCDHSGSTSWVFTKE